MNRRGRSVPVRYSEEGLNSGHLIDRDCRCANIGIFIFRTNFVFVNIFRCENVVTKVSRKFTLKKW